jgi:hypothetical protein
MKEYADASNLLSLPDELLVLIMQYMHNGTDVVHFGHTCHRLEALTQSQPRVWETTRVDKFTREVLLLSKFFDNTSPLFTRRNYSSLITSRKDYLLLHRHLHSSNASIERKLMNIQLVQQNMEAIQYLLFTITSSILFSWIVLAFLVLYNGAVLVGVLYIPVNMLAILYMLILGVGSYVNSAGARKFTFWDSATSLFKVSTAVGPLWLFATVVLDKMIRQLQHPDFLDPQQHFLNYWSTLLALPCICVIIMADKQSSMIIPYSTTRWAVRLNTAFWPLYLDGFWFVRWVPIPEITIYGSLWYGFLLMIRGAPRKPHLTTICVISTMTAPMFLKLAAYFGCTYVVLIPVMVTMLASLLQAILQARAKIIKRENF